MFSTGSSPYSPFFTSGLLSAHLLQPSSSRAPSPLPTSLPRRGSLPSDNLSKSPPQTHDQSSAFYFTMQPKRDRNQFRSFLSLDLAESQSMRSASLKRKASQSRKAISRIPEIPTRQAVPRVPSPALYSLRAMPSPKPAPSMTLPDLPKEASISPPTTPHLSTKSTSINFDFKFPQFFLPPVRVSRSRTPKSLVQLPPRRQSVLSQAQTTSSISTRAKKVNRSDALARLEGRVNPLPKTRVPSFTPSRNFMNMSDDEDDTDFEDDFEHLDPKGDYGDDLFYAVFEPEDLVLPALSPPLSPTSISSSPRRSSSSPTKFSIARRQMSRRTTKDWFPLKSFIDLKNDDESSNWSWRSFIDVASVS